MFDQAEWDMQWRKKGRPSTWEEFASWVDEYMRLKEGWVAFEERNIYKTIGRPTLLQSLVYILFGHKPRMCEEVEKYAIIKLMDKHGELIVHATFEYEALVVMDGSRVVELGKKLKRVMEKDNHAQHC